MVLKDLAAALDNIDFEKARNTNGVVSKLKDGTVIKNDRYPFLDNLDTLPPLNIDFLPKNVEYFNPIVIELPYITVSTSHGCPGKCNYCTAPFFHGAKTRFQSPGKVLDDIGYYLSKGIKEIYYRDTYPGRVHINFCNCVYGLNYEDMYGYKKSRVRAFFVEQFAPYPLDKFR